jgi:hypothetical protein
MGKLRGYCLVCGRSVSVRGGLMDSHRGDGPTACKGSGSARHVAEARPREVARVCPYSSGEEYLEDLARENQERQRQWTGESHG